MKTARTCFLSIFADFFVADADKVAEGAGIRVHVVGLDTIRLACALLVVWDHLAPPLMHGGEAGKIIGILFWGQPAIAVFFVISGFCIHLPQALGVPLNIGSFFIRRLVRLCVPLVVLILAEKVAGLDVATVNGVVWSLYCEMAYYLAYPFLLYWARTTGWIWLVGITLVLSLAEMIRLPQPSAYYHHGFWGMILLGLPVWIMGCVLARWYASNRFPPRIPAAYLARLGMFAGGTFLNFLHFHAGIGYSWTLWLYAWAAVWWLRLEISHATKAGAIGFLEAAGAASYSIYICHLPVYMLCVRAGLNRNTLKGDLICIVACLLSSALFFVLVEFPSVRLAKYLGRSFENIFPA
jgi:peptidoglycan/LPS O-acetylase OafA/YrhL